MWSVTGRNEPRVTDRPPAAVVVLSPLMVFGVLIALIAWTRRRLLAVRERRLRAQAQRAS